MTSQDFCCWLLGFFEIHGPCKLSHAQVQVIWEKLAEASDIELAPLRMNAPVDPEGPNKGPQ